MTTIRAAAVDDIEACRAIYAYWVEHGTGSFELEAPDGAEMARRHADVIGRGLPWLVAVDEPSGKVLGYAYANWFRPRPAYRFCVEDSVYVDPVATRAGLGRRLLERLIQECTAAGSRQMLAVIGDSANLGSIGVHAALGFRHAGLLAAAGWKFGRWLDVVLMQRSLGAGRDAIPA